MRRRRHKLEVSTFPFLAVLLCAMGSLILMLLVLDRRAKAAARERAQRAAEQISAEELRLAAERRLEWERRRQALHAELESQEQTLRGKLATVETEIAATESKLHAHQERQQAEHEKLSREREELARLEQDVAAHRSEVAHAADKVQDSEQELRRITGDLKMLERTLAELKAMRQRQQNTYSVVPYRGRRGAERTPLYLECAAGGLIFHPDHKMIAPTRSGGDDVRAEVERRIHTPAAAGKTPGTPYLLLLVRPDGISTYYLALKCLQGLDLEYGYELIDDDWVLEFPKDHDEIKQQPWMVAEKPSGKDLVPGVKQEQNAGTGGRISDPAEAGRIGNPAYDSLSTESGRTAPTGITASGNGTPSASGQAGGDRQPTGVMAVGSPSGVLAGASPAQTAWQPGFSGTGGGAPASGPWHSASGGQVGGPGIGGSAGDKPMSPGLPGAPASATLGPATPGGPPRGVNFGGPGVESEAPLTATPSTPQEMSRGTGNVGRTEATSPASPITGGNGIGGPPGTRMPATAGTQNNSAMPATGPAIQQAGSGAPSLGPPVPSPGSGQGSANSGGADVQARGPSAQPAGEQPSRETVGAAPHSPTPLPASASPGSPSRSGGTQESSATGSEKTATTDARAGQSGEVTPSPSAGERRPGLRSLGDPLPGNKRKGPPPTLRPALIGGDRDYIIPVECRADKIIVHPYGNSFSADSLAPGNGGAVLLQETINRMIARRQMAVRPGELPFRPQVRFMVRPDGLRALHRAYPVLDELHIPMTRQNLDAEEEISVGEN
jgi:hypothetical protein